MICRILRLLHLKWRSLEVFINACQRLSCRWITEGKAIGNVSDVDIKDINPVTKSTALDENQRGIFEIDD